MPPCSCSEGEALTVGRLGRGFRVSLAGYLRILPCKIVHGHNECPYLIDKNGELFHVKCIPDIYVSSFRLDFRI